MEIGALGHKLDISKIPLEKLSGNPNISEEEKTAEVSRQFEAVLMRQILQEGQKSVFKSTIIKESFANGIYQDMVTEKIADSISRSESLGLAQSFKPQLARQANVAASDAPGAGTSSEIITPKHP